MGSVGSKVIGNGGKKNGKDKALSFIFQIEIGSFGLD